MILLYSQKNSDEPLLYTVAPQAHQTTTPIIFIHLFIIPTTLFFRLDRAGKVQSAIDRFRPGDHETLKYLFDTRQILELRFGSHVPEERERIGYIAELITKFFHQNLSIYIRCKVLITTAPKHPASSNEIQALHSVIAPLLGMSPDEGKSSGLRFFHQTDEALGRNVKLFLVLSR